MILKVKIIPNAKATEIIGFDENQVLKVKIKAPPEKGKANLALVNFLAKKLKIAKNQITIISGLSSRFKVLKIENISSFDGIF
jgi:uncharacterized protein